MVEPVVSLSIRGIGIASPSKSAADSMPRCRTFTPGVEDLDLDDIILEEAEADAAREREVDYERDGEEW